MSDPMVPPTPPVSLEALLARADLGLRRVAGPDDPATVVHWAHASEMADPYPYLLGGELLLSAGVHIPEGAGAGYFDAYVSRIVAAGGAALGFGLAPVHDAVPGALVEACEMHGLPLLEVPPRTTFSGVARAVWQLMAQARLAELRRVTEAQQSLAAAASRPDPLAPLLHQLAQRVGGWAALYSPDSTELATAGPPPAPETRRALTTLTQVVRPATAPTADRADATTTSRAEATTGSRSTPTPASRADATTGSRATPTAGSRADDTAGSRAAGAARVGAAAPRSADPRNTPRPAPTSATDTTNGTHLTTYALGPHGHVLGIAAPHRTPGDHTIASAAAVLLTLLTAPHRSRTSEAGASALVRLLLGASPEDVAPLLGAKHWQVVHARPNTQEPPEPLATAALATALGSPLIDPAGDTVRALVPADRPVDPLPGWTLGVSTTVTPEDWPAADTQAARALSRARALRTPLLRHGDRPALADLVEPHDADVHARTLLAPIAAAPALMDTLRTWLSLHGSWDRTAVALSVHRNTVRQRIARCAALLEADLDDPDVRMELWFALRRT
ncbi:helix-turn-helix domain-containing protein [Streptomyces sp. NPDC087226]|uniref:helix-turn-helix domain-containing protein n=1 Tax=Streptomyces sp. NPDC087226 TaxID=3365771 RepID=UPI0037F3F89D